MKQNEKLLNRDSLICIEQALHVQICDPDILVEEGRSYGHALEIIRFIRGGEETHIRGRRMPNKMQTSKCG